MWVVRVGAQMLGQASVGGDEAGWAALRVLARWVCKLHPRHKKWAASRAAWHRALPPPHTRLRQQPGRGQEGLCHRRVAEQAGVLVRCVVQRLGQVVGVGRAAPAGPLCCAACGRAGGRVIALLVGQVGAAPATAARSNRAQAAALRSPPTFIEQPPPPL